MASDLCQVCRRRFRLNRDGMMRRHMFMGFRCYGSGEPARAALAKWEASRAK